VNQMRSNYKRRERRRFRVRRNIHGVADRPRLSVFRSHKHIAVQVINDTDGRTLVSASTRDKGSEVGYGGNKTAAEAIGRKIAELAIAAGITQVKFDRGEYKYHGRVAALADAARAAGLSL